MFKSGGIQRSAHILKSKVNCATHLTPPRGTPDVAATQTSQPMPSQLARQPHCAKRPVQGRSDCALHQVFPAANSNCGETHSHHANLQGWTLTPAALSVAAQRLTCTLLSNSPFARSCLARCGRGGCKLPACLQEGLPKPQAALAPDLQTGQRQHLPQAPLLLRRQNRTVFTAESSGTLWSSSLACPSRPARWPATAPSPGPAARRRRGGCARARPPAACSAAPPPTRAASRARRFWGKSSAS